MGIQISKLKLNELWPNFLQNSIFFSSFPLSSSSMHHSSSPHLSPSSFSSSTISPHLSLSPFSFFSPISLMFTRELEDTVDDDVHIGDDAGGVATGEHAFFSLLSVRRFSRCYKREICKLKRLQITDIPLPSPHLLQAFLAEMVTMSQHVPTLNENTFSLSRRG